MKIIFLDIDGVLNCHYLTIGNIIVDGGTLNTVLVEKLNTLIRETNAKVVISSSWRILNTQAEIIDMLQSAGFQGEVIGMTPRSCNIRGVEIHDWLKSRNDVENYIILDDDSDMLLWQASHFFNTDCEFGLTDKIVYKAARFLNGHY